MNWSYILERAGEASTVRGVLMFIGGAIGFDISPETATQITSAVMAFVGLAGVFLPDKIKK